MCAPEIIQLPTRKSLVPATKKYRALVVRAIVYFLFCGRTTRVRKTTAGDTRSIDGFTRPSRRIHLESTRYSGGTPTCPRSSREEIIIGRGRKRRISRIPFAPPPTPHTPFFYDRCNPLSLSSRGDKRRRVIYTMSGHWNTRGSRGLTIEFNHLVIKSSNYSKERQ